jgi:hypothetical protein
MHKWRKLGLTASSEIQQVMVTPAAAAMASPSSLREAGPTTKKAHTKNCQSLSAWYLCE